MDSKSGDDDTGEVRWSWSSDESGRGCEVSEEVDQGLSFPKLSDYLTYFKTCMFLCATVYTVDAVDVFVMSRGG